jgi:hypothetical protein
MQNSAWIALLRHIPAEQQSRFMLVTASGIEIAIQSFLLIEQECVAIKGRLAGSQDQGRVFFIPYANIDNFGFSQPVKDTEFTEMFNGLTLAAEAPPPAVPPTNGQVAAAVELEPPAETPEPVDESTDDSRPTIRSEVLERFRSRLSIPSPAAAAAAGLNNPQRTQP